VTGLLGILLGLALLVWLAFRGWSILLLAPGAALIAAAFAGGPLLAYWTQTFMDSASRFVAQFFPLFLLGALFGKLMEDSGSVAAIAEFMTKWLGPSRAMLTVVLAGALVTYGGVSLFVVVFVLVPMAQALFRTAQIGVDPIRPDTRRVGKGCTPGVSDSPAGSGDARCCSPPSTCR
jgi:H+/gluconate symporter-like permease